MANCIIMRVSAICTTKATTTKTTRDTHPPAQTVANTATKTEIVQKQKCNKIRKNKHASIILDAASSELFGFPIRKGGRWAVGVVGGGNGSFAGITFRFVQKLIEFHKLFQLLRRSRCPALLACSLALAVCPSLSFVAVLPLSLSLALVYLLAHSFKC